MILDKGVRVLSLLFVMVMNAAAEMGLSDTEDADVNTMFTGNGTFRIPMLMSSTMAQEVKTLLTNSSTLNSIQANGVTKRENLTTVITVTRQPGTDGSQSMNSTSKDHNIIMDQSSTVPPDHISRPKWANFTKAPSKIFYKYWKNGDVLCLKHSECGKQGICHPSNYDMIKVCKCRSTGRHMTHELKCPGKNHDKNKPIDKAVECSIDPSICNPEAECVSNLMWTNNISICFCRNTRQPMTRNFTCPPREPEDDHKPYPLIDCTEKGIVVCGSEAVCIKYGNDTTKKYCICPHMYTPLPPNMSCPLKRSVDKFPGHTIYLQKAFRPEKHSIISHVVNGNWIPSFILFLIFVSVVGGVVLYVYNECVLKRQTKEKQQNLQRLVQLENTFLRDERYQGNPHYSLIDTEDATPLLPVSTIRRSQITDLTEIGEGCFGKVFKGQLHTMEGVDEGVETVAIKMLKRSTSREAEDNFMREVEIMSTFRHENILGLTGFCARDQDNGPWMVFEYMRYGDLVTVLRNSNHPWLNLPNLPRLSEDGLLSTAHQIAEGMSYLAQQRFVHRDLACRNCLVGLGLVVKVADFGMSRDVYTCDYYRMGGGAHMLPIRWMSPESLQYGKFTLESDIWSYGVVLWEIFSLGKQPYFGHTNEEALTYILSERLLKASDLCPPEVAEIMKACFKTDPKERITFSEICERFSRIVPNTRPRVEMSVPRPHSATYTSYDDDTDVDDYNFGGSTTELRPKNSFHKEFDEDGYLKPHPPSDGKSKHAYENKLMVPSEMAPLPPSTLSPIPSSSSSTSSTE